MNRPDSQPVDPAYPLDSFNRRSLMVIAWSITAALLVALFVILSLSKIKYTYACFTLQNYAVMARTDLLDFVQIIRQESRISRLVVLQKNPGKLHPLFADMALAQSGADGIKELESLLPSVAGMERTWTLAAIELAQPGYLKPFLVDLDAEPALWLTAAHAAALVDAYAVVDFGRQMDGRYICLFPGKKEVDQRILTGFENGLNRLLTDPNEDTDTASGAIITKSSQARRFLDDYLANNPEIYKARARKKWQAKFEAFAIKQFERRDASLVYKRLARSYVAHNSERLTPDCWEVINRLMSGHYLENPVDLRPGNLKTITSNGTMVVRAHAASATTAAISPTDGRIASGGFDNLVKIWPAGGLGTPLTLAGHSLGILAVAWSPDGKALASAGLDGTIRIWDTAAARQINSIPADTVRVGALAYSPDGTLLAAVAPKDKIRLVNPATGEVRKILSGPRNEVTSLAFSPDGRYVVAGCYDKTAVAWDLFAGASQRPAVLPEPPGRFLMKHGGQVLSVAISPDGKMIATGCFDQTARIFNLAIEDEKGQTLNRHLAPVAAVAWAPDSSIMAAYSIEGKLILWNPTTKQIATMHHLTATANALVFSQNGQSVIAACNDGTIRIWKIIPGQIETRSFREWAVDFFGKANF